jgi:uncharacterized protein YxjI
MVCNPRIGHLVVSKLSNMLEPYMKYALKQKWFSLGKKFPIVDEKGLEAYRVDGSAMAIGKRMSFRDNKNTELAFISQKMHSTGPAFEIYHGDDLQAVVRKDNFSLSHCKFSADASAPDDLHAEGNLNGQEYTFTREGKPVGRVSKSLFGLGSYGVEVGRGEDELVLLASAFVIDLCCQTRLAS